MCAAQGDMKAKFLRHEGFLGAVGAFLKVHPMSPPKESTTSAREPRKARPQPLLHMAHVDKTSSCQQWNWFWALQQLVAYVQPSTRLLVTQVKVHNVALCCKVIRHVQ